MRDHWPGKSRGSSLVSVTALLRSTSESLKRGLERNRHRGPEVRIGDLVFAAISKIATINDDLKPVTTFLFELAPATSLSRLSRCIARCISYRVDVCSIRDAVTSPRSESVLKMQGNQRDPVYGTQGLIAFLSSRRSRRHRAARSRNGGFIRSRCFTVAARAWPFRSRWNNAGTW